MRVLITGANGYVGARLYEDLRRDYEVYGTYHTHVSTELLKGDITNPTEIKSIIDKVKPELIVHAAALVGRKLCEENPELAYSVNVEGTKNVALSAKNIRAKVIHISTGAVLNPEQNGIYGKTKLEAERILTEASDNYVILRCGMILGGSPQKREDSSFNQFLSDVTNKMQTVYDDAYRYQITWVGHVSETIAEIQKRNIDREILPLVTKDAKTKYEIARDVLTNFGIVPKAKREGAPPERKFQAVDKLQELHMPVYSYQEVVDKVVKEMKDALERTEQS